MSTPLIPTSWESFLSVTTDREQTIADNMANVDTPGYQTQDVNFEQALATASDGMQGAAFSPRLLKVRGLMQRPDGNNVNIDRESLLLAQSQLQFQIGTSLVKDRFHQVMSAISGGQ
jgi:flagellar basal-body rod protein FlgB